MNKDQIKLRCTAYKNMIKAQAKYIEAKEQYYEANNAKPEAPQVTPAINFVVLDEAINHE